MKPIAAAHRAFRFSAALGLTALFAGLMAQSPAHADDDWRFHRYRDNVRFDIIAVHHDEDRLHDLYRRRSYLRDRRDWRGVERIDIEIGNVRFHLDHDRYEARRDYDRDRRAHEYEYSRDRYRDNDRSRDQYRDYGSSRDRNRDGDGGYRVRQNY